MNRISVIRLFAASLALILLSFALATPRAARATSGGTIVVDDSSDVGVCSGGSYTLRCAIVYANTSGNTFTNIRFAPGLPAVLLQSALPTITGNGTWIDGHDISNGCVCPRIDAALASAWSGTNGLTINANDVTISNVKVVNIPDGDDISVIGGKDAKITGDFLGILPSASGCPAVAATVGVGVAHDSAGSAGTGNGTAYIFANTISCHTGSGVEIVGSSFVYVGQDSGGNYVGNQIGTTADGLGAAGNGYAGVRIAVNSSSILVRKNLIAYNATAGVLFDGNNLDISYNTLAANGRGLEIGDGSNQVVVGNNIGTRADGLTPWPNTNEGIFIVNGSGGLFVSGNVVANNGGAGIAVIGSTTRAAIQDNTFRGNGGLPIDLGDDGPTVNGSHGFGDPGPNNWLKYPVVTSFSGSFVFGTTCPNCVVYVYKALGNPAAPGGGGTIVTNVSANGSGQWAVDLSSYSLSRLDVTFMAYQQSNQTVSEMSPRPVLLLPLVRR